MEKDFIPYEQALALKELGFNEPCFGYHYNRELSFGARTSYGEVVEAPTFSQAFKWFREKYFLDKIIDSWTQQPVGNEIWDKAYQYYINGEAYYPYFKTYEEAELECLKKLIEIVKRK